MMYNSPFSDIPYYKKFSNSNNYNYINNNYSNNSYPFNKNISSIYRNNNYYNNCFPSQIYKNNNSNYNNPLHEKDTFKKTIIEENKEPEIFEIFGLKLYFDDILLICLIFFLYNEGVKDYYLFISLILLLLS